MNAVLHGSPPQANRVVLQAQDLVLRLGGQRVVDGVSLAFAAGQWAAIVGPNGAGKSTLLALLAGLRFATLNDHSIDDVPRFSAELAALARSERSQPDLVDWLEDHLLLLDVNNTSIIDH